MENLTNISTDQFFQREHFETFEGNKIFQNTPTILKERKEVQQQLLHLHDQLYPEIQLKRWKIYPHNSVEHQVAGIDIDTPFIPKKINSIWLHYGKHHDEIKEYQSLAADKSTQTFIHHSRMQVIVYNFQKDNHYDYGIGTWLVIGKNGGSQWDRDFFRKSMGDTNYQDRFFSLVSELDDDYFVSCNSETRNVRQFSGKESLKDFTYEANFNDYFIIGKAFDPDDLRMSSNNIVQTVMTEFAKLYPIFEYTRHRF